ncbi:MAG: hypothetical protein M1144_01885 [Candidatus Thermoplasmatota archaeon]|jgi:hypothetical protein|nr:hypothetical protein [Candidatus Thermoplasmatota archaeon]MCL5984034.1 hypothetical protein [Candidatus Thermoplasmatota archaeon]
MSTNWYSIIATGKPVVTVSGGTTSVGTTGADFGYDTQQGNTTPGNYGGTPRSPTCGINEALSYAANNGLPLVLLRPDTFTITSSIVIPANGIQFMGSGGGFVAGLPGQSSTSPVGTVINIPSGSSAFDAIQIFGTSTAPIRNVYIGGFSITFGNTSTGTGHGINCNPPVNPDNTQYNLQGLTGSVFKDILVSGHDNSHYAFVFVNEIYNVYENLSCQGGLGLLFQENDNVTGSANNYGNSTFTNITLGVGTGGTVPVQFVATHDNGVNLCVFNRFQIGLNNSSVFGMLLKNCTWMVFNGLDIEFSSGSTNFKALQLSSCTMVQINGGNPGAQYGSIDLVGASSNIVIVDPTDVTVTNSDSSTLSGILILGGTVSSISSANDQAVRWLGAPVQAISSVTVSGNSPFKYVNGATYDVTATVSGGTVSKFVLQRGSTQLTVNLSSGMFFLAAGDTLWIYFSSAPALQISPH